MSAATGRRRHLHPVPKPAGTIDADMVAFTVMEYIDQKDPTFWEPHPKGARVDLRNAIVRAVSAADGKR
jgi:hypothetical protein